MTELPRLILLPLKLLAKMLVLPVALAQAVTPDGQVLRFDASNWRDPVEPPEPARLRPGQERALAWTFLGVGLFLLVAPISLGSAVDLVRYLLGL